MTLQDFEQRGFKLIAEFRIKPDERGIDGTIILRKINRKGPRHQSTIILRKINRKGPRHQSTIYTAAHYRVGNRYGEPVPVPPQVIMGAI